MPEEGRKFGIVDKNWRSIMSEAVSITLDLLGTHTLLSTFVGDNARDTYIHRPMLLVCQYLHTYVCTYVCRYIRTYVRRYIATPATGIYDVRN